MYIHTHTHTYIDTTPGLPLGYQTSQLFALMFLDEFDHIIKEKYQIKRYGRYMDDFFVILPDKAELQRLLKDVQALMSEYKLELNDKTAIFPLRNGIDFLGFHSYLTENGGVVQKLRQESINRIRGRIKKWRRDYTEGKISKEKIIEKFTSWDAHAAHGDTHSLRRKYADQVEEIIGEKIRIHRKINSTLEVRAKRRLKQYKYIAKKRELAGEASPFSFSPNPLSTTPQGHKKGETWQQ